MIRRLMLSQRLDPIVYQQIADDPSSTVEAYVLASVAAIISASGALFGGSPFLSFLLQAGNNLLIGWILWAVIA